MKRMLRASAAAFALVALGFGTAGLPAEAVGVPAGIATGTQTYLVVLRQAPVASYHGTLAGYPATAPPPGQRFANDRGIVAAYRAHLLAEQASLLRQVGSPEVVYSYTTALDGFAATLTAAQATTLQGSPDVLLVQPDSLVRVDGAGPVTATGASPSPTADPMHVSAPTGLWDQVGGAARAGRGVVVGVIDTGVSPDNPSLAGIPVSPAFLAHRYPGFTGACEPGVRWTAASCTSKVVAARYFVRGFGSSKVAQSDYLSPRDGSGHGTSVAAIAAGNSGVDTTIAGQDFGHISGMAPAAGLSIYKACWSAPDPNGDGCDTADTVKAIDQAVQDGVDVINYSIGGTTSSLGDAVELAFLNAAAANVFVAASAGNSGPAAGTVQHPSPWVTTVGANTHDVFQGGIKLGNGQTLVGAMLSNENVGPAPLVYAADAPAAGVAAARAALCYPGSLDAQRVDGAIVVCDRGTTSRVSKSEAVDQSGGAAMVLVNTGPGSVDADLHHVPTVHVDQAAGRVVKAYVAQSGDAATGTIVADATNSPEVPTVADFSGRGPTTVAGGDLLKPDLTAPGVSVVSAVTPVGGSGQLWDVESGTSIAAPHAAGLAAVVRAAEPTWSPATIKSAMMTTAAPLVGPNNSLTRGAGELDSRNLLQPGLVYSSGLSDWTDLLRGDGIRLDGGRHTARLDATELNQPSIAVGDLVGSEQVTRTVTNVGTTTETYTSSLEGLHGVASSISPASLTVAPGRSASFTITFTAKKTASYGTFTTGALTWRDSRGTTVTSPVAVRPQLASTPAELTGSGRHGSATITGVAGVTGTIRASTSGLVGSTPVSLDLQPGTFSPQHPATSVSTAVETLTIPPGSRAARFQVLAQRSGGDADIYLYRGTTLVDSATGSSPDETLTLTAPTPGTYRAFVNLDRSASDTGASSVAFTSWVLPRADQGNLIITPDRLGVDGGSRFSVTSSWAHLDAGRRWWGYVAFRGLPSVTYLTVN